MAKATTTKCCNAAIYRDAIDHGHYCMICDRPVDPKTGEEARR